MKHYQKTKPKGLAFHIVLLTFSVIISAGIIFSLYHLWEYLDEYEQHNPTGVVNEFIDILSNKRYDDLLLLTGLELDYFNDTAEFKKYIDLHFFANPGEITALKAKSTGEILNYNIYAGGNIITSLELSPNKTTNKFGMKGWEISLKPIVKKNSIKIFLPKNSQFFVNEKLVTDDFKLPLTYDIIEFPYNDNRDISPYYSIFEVTNLLNPPIIRVVTENGVNCKIIENKGIFTAFPEISDNQIAEISKLVEKVSIMYAMFTYQDCTFNDISPYLLKDSDFYTRIKSFKNEWQPPHTFSYDNVNISDIVVYDSLHFTAKISFTCKLQRGYNSNTYDISYSPKFYKENDNWLLVTL